MVSSGDEVEVPSDEESKSSHRHTKNSSNDSDSGEARPSHKRKKFGSPRTEAQAGVDGSMSERSSNAEPQDLEALKTPDELLLMEMSEEERIFYEKEKDTVIDDVSLQCTKCLDQLSLSNAEYIKIHPALGVIICKICHEFYSKANPFVKDSNGSDEHCRWCAEGSEVNVICCSDCPNVFCVKCILKNLKLDKYMEIKKLGKWSCLSCNKKPIWTQRALCRKVFMAVKEDRLHSGKPLQTRPAEKSSDSIICLPSDTIAVIASIMGHTLEDKLEATQRVTRESNLSKPEISGNNSSRSDSKFPKPRNQPKEDVSKKRAARMALLESDDDGDTSNSSNKVLQQVKAASSKKSFAGAPPTLDNPKLKMKKKKKKTKKKSKELQITSDSYSDSEMAIKWEKPKKRKGKQPPSDQDDSEAESKPKRRRRSKKTAASAPDGHSEDSDVEMLSKSHNPKAGASKGRKNIKKIIPDQDLHSDTKAAAEEEEARRERIRQMDAIVGGSATSSRTGHLALDCDPNTKEELVTVHQDIVAKLKPHQVEGVKFMWRACFESVERLKNHPGSGCILAHCMGLGKTLQVVTLAHTVLTHQNCKVKRVLVLGPLSTVLNWYNEFKRWLPGDLELKVYEMTKKEKNFARAKTLRDWMESGGVLVMGYDLYKTLTSAVNKNEKESKAKVRKTLQRALVKPGPDLLICDEGHILKNEGTTLFSKLNMIRTQRRIVLTGTPLQNRLDEYHCMIQFVKPNLLGTKKEFTNRFANPIKNGQAADSTDSDVRVMKRRAHVLHKMLEGSVQRFSYSVLTPFLPPKHEYVINVKMSDIQIKMYQHYLDNYAKGGPSNAGMRVKGAGLFADFQELGRVWTHPKALLMAQINRDNKKANAPSDEVDLNNFFEDDQSAVGGDDDVICLDEKADETEPESNERIAWRSRTRSGRGDAPLPEDELRVTAQPTAPINGCWWSSFVTEDDMAKIEHSGKLVLLMDIIRQCELAKDKVLVFSQSLVSLDLIEEFLALEEKKNEEARAAPSQASSGKIEQAVTWRKNEDYYRLDGSTKTDLRNTWIKSFNNSENLRSRLFLISTKTGGIGINLTAANRVIVYDASWNPSHDVQSIFRVYRFGQAKPCYVYRFISQGTMEEKIYKRQVTKLSLSCRVVDEEQIERHFTSADIEDIYKFEPVNSQLRRPTLLVPKDRLLAELTIQRKDWIVNYHEHDSLLENKLDEELTEEERNAAWDDFENERRGVVNVMAHAGGLMPGFKEILESLDGRYVAGVPLISVAETILKSNPGITQDDFLGRFRSSVVLLEKQENAAAAAATPPPPEPNPVQQQDDAQRLLMQSQMASEQMTRQFVNGASQPSSAAGPSSISSTPSARVHPPFEPHQRTDLGGANAVLAAPKASTKAAWDDTQKEKREAPNVMAPSSPLKNYCASLEGKKVADIPLTSIAARILKSNPGISHDDFLGLFQLEVKKLKKQQYAAEVAAAPPPPAPNPVKQQDDAQRTLMQTQMASKQMQRQFGNSASQPSSAAGPSGISNTPRARGRPPIDPHHRTDVHGVGPVLAAKKPPGGSPSVPNPKLNPSSKI